MSLSPSDGLPDLNLSKTRQYTFPSSLASLISLKLKRLLTAAVIGPYGCIGKALALMELRYVVANLVNRYEISLAPDQREDVFLNSKVDALALNPGPLMTVFKKRNHTENKRA